MQNASGTPHWDRMHAQKARKNGSASRLNWRKNSTGCDASFLLISYLSISQNVFCIITI